MFDAHDNAHRGMEEWVTMELIKDSEHLLRDVDPGHVARVPNCIAYYGFDYRFNFTWCTSVQPVVESFELLANPNYNGRLQPVLQNVFQVASREQASLSLSRELFSSFPLESWLSVSPNTHQHPKQGS